MPAFEADTLSEAVYAATQRFHRPIEYKQPLFFKKLDKPREKYPFFNRALGGNVLLVGEGNFSFALSLASAAKPIQHSFVATSPRSLGRSSNETQTNAREIQRLGGTVKTGVDSTSLSRYFPRAKFD